MQSNPIETLLARLDGVRKAGKGWAARCPAHDDKGPSLHITETDTGTVLLHCFAECPPAVVVAAAGLSWVDLFVRRSDRGRLSPTQRRVVDRETRIARQWAALNAILPEIAVIEVAARHLADASCADVAFADRVASAYQRIHDIRVNVQRGIS